MRDMTLRVNSLECWRPAPGKFYKFLHPAGLRRAKKRNFNLFFKWHLLFYLVDSGHVL